MSSSPSDEELKAALQELRLRNPLLGISKIHTLLLSIHPHWTVSEKRTRKILQSEGLVVGPPKPRPKDEADGTSKESEAVYPSSKIVEGLDIKQWTNKVEVKDFGRGKGKGLVATQEVKEGEVVWKEDPWIIAPEWSIYDLQVRSRACAYCTTPLTDSSLVVACPASSSGPNEILCTARFCNRLCLTRSSRTHPLLCPNQNPASVPLLKYAKKLEWMACLAAAHCIARVLLANEKGKEELDREWKFVSALAEMGMEDRFKQAGMAIALEPNRETWRVAHWRTIQAFQEPTTALEKKKLSKLLTKPLPEEVAKGLFDYKAYLRCLGRMSLNLEAHGGLYMLHSHLNHTCAPNISIRHLDTSKALSRITVVAKKDIVPGDELFVTYVDPGMGLNERRRELRAWGFGLCKCKRCLEEEKALLEKKADMTEDHVKEGEVHPDLEDELRAGFGIV